MRTTKLRLPIAFVFALAAAAGCHSKSANTQTQEQVRQSGIAARAFQINQSNLPPDEKQRLLGQIGANGANPAK
jgi:hypothetical protein